MTQRNYLALDLETAKILPDEVGDLLAHRPLGIACAATWTDGDDAPGFIYSTDAAGRPAPSLRREDASAWVDVLLERVAAGHTLLTWNGAGFDFDILAEESGRLEDCRRLALDHVDMMFHLFCAKGFPVGLASAAAALGLGKTAGMDGAMAPHMWRGGEHQRVLDYAGQDCRVTLQIALAAERAGRFDWITRRGSRSSLDLPGGWLTVRRALELPEPDVSWMDNPWPRSKFTGWLV